MAHEAPVEVGRQIVYQAQGREVFESDRLNEHLTYHSRRRFSRKCDYNRISAVPRLRRASEGLRRESWPVMPRAQCADYYRPTLASAVASGVGLLALRSKQAPLPRVTGISGSAAARQRGPVDEEDAERDHADGNSAVAEVDDLRLAELSARLAHHERDRHLGETQGRDAHNGGKIDAGLSSGTPRAPLDPRSHRRPSACPYRGLGSEATVGPEEPDVAAVQPAIAVDSSCGFLGLVVVPLHDRQSRMQISPGSPGAGTSL